MLFTKVVTKKLTQEVELSKHYTITPIHNLIFNVHDGRKSLNVNLETHSCPCREWDYDLIPCSQSHIIAVIQNGQHILMYVHNFYKRSTHSQIYSCQVNPVGPQSEWIVSVHVAKMSVLPPIPVPQAGRSRNSRRQSAVENMRLKTRPSTGDQPSSSRQAARLDTRDMAAHRDPQEY
ncbi:hypothetical protein OROHE_022247 [Orobanche hederae]